MSATCLAHLILDFYMFLIYTNVKYVAWETELMLLPQLQSSRGWGSVAGVKRDRVTNTVLV
jgi:hypothetical protein